MYLPPSDPALSFAEEASCCCAFLCDEVGQIVQDFGEQRPGSPESISARSLIALIERRSFFDFIRSVRTHGVTLGWETMIEYAGFARCLLLHGFQTPLGILTFAPVAPSKSIDPVSVMESRAKGGEDAAHLLVEVAHDLQNPISSIISACEYLAAYSGGNSNRTQREMIAGIEASAVTLLRVSGRISKLAVQK